MWDFPKLEGPAFSVKRDHRVPILQDLSLKPPAQSACLWGPQDCGVLGARVPSDSFSLEAPRREHESPISQPSNVSYLESDLFNAIRRHRSSETPKMSECNRSVTVCLRQWVRPSLSEL